MNRNSLWSLLGLLALATSVGGCLPDLTLQFNGRTIVVEDLDEASFPRGLEIFHFDGKQMRVEGKESISVNEKDLRVKGSTVEYGDFTGSVNADQKLVIKKNGEFAIKDEPNAGEESSWWAFWR